MFFIPKSETFINMQINYQLDELLKKVNESSNIVQGLRDIYSRYPHTKVYLEQSVNDVYPNFDAPVYKLSEYHRSMAGAYLRTQSAVNIVTKVLLNPVVSEKNKLYQLKNLLEMLCPGESIILVAVLNKNIPELYSNITHEAICESLT